MKRARGKTNVENKDDIRKWTPDDVNSWVRKQLKNKNFDDKHIDLFLVEFKPTYLNGHGLFRLQNSHDWYEFKNQFSLNHQAMYGMWKEFELAVMDLDISIHRNNNSACKPRKQRKFVSPTLITINNLDPNYGNDSTSIADTYSQNTVSMNRHPSIETSTIRTTDTILIRQECVTSHTTQL